MVNHGHSKNNNNRTPTYLSWAGMKQRCLNPNHDKYHNYGGRGIKICARWMIFANFLKDMGIRPAGKTLDRKDGNKNYYKANCRWVDIITQNNNRRKRADERKKKK